MKSDSVILSIDKSDFHQHTYTPKATKLAKLVITVINNLRVKLIMCLGSIIHSCSDRRDCRPLLPRQRPPDGVATDGTLDTPQQSQDTVMDEPDSGSEKYVPVRGNPIATGRLNNSPHLRAIFGQSPSTPKQNPPHWCAYRWHQWFKVRWGHKTQYG